MNLPVASTISSEYLASRNRTRRARHMRSYGALCTQAKATRRVGMGALRCTTESRQLCTLCMCTRWLRPLRWAAGALAYASGFGARGSVDAALGRCHVSTLHCARPLEGARSRGGHAGYALPAFQSRDWYRWDSIGRPRTSGPVRKDSADRLNDLPCVYVVWRVCVA
jgi:hypothetical protein